MNIWRHTVMVSLLALISAVSGCSSKDEAEPAAAESQAAAASEAMPQELQDAGKILNLMNAAIDSVRRTHLDFYEANLPAFTACQERINDALENGSTEQKVDTIYRCATVVAKDRCWITGHRMQGSPECVDLIRELEHQQWKRAQALAEREAAEAKVIAANRCKGHPAQQECMAFEEKMNAESSDEKKARLDALEQEREKNMMEVQKQCTEPELCPPTEEIDTQLPV